MGEWSAERRTGVADDHLGRQQLVERVGELRQLRRRQRVARHVKGADLAARVHPSIRAAGGFDDNGLCKHALERGSQQLVAQAGPATVLRAVVARQEGESAEHMSV